MSAQQKDTIDYLAKNEEVIGCLCGAYTDKFARLLPVLAGVMAEE